MFSWSPQKAPAGGPKAPYPPSFDPLKGLKGAQAFYELFEWSQPEVPKGPTKVGSAATFYAPAKDKAPKPPQEEVATEGPASEAQAGDKGPAPSACPGVDQVNALLRLGKQQLADPSSKCKFKAIMGSEVADLDATVCSLVYAAVAYQREASGNPAAPPASCPLPVLLTKRADFRLRSETHWLLTSMGVDVDLLTFMDEVDLRKLYGEGRLQVVLVGMKNMPEPFQGLEGAVLEILPKPSMTPASDSVKGASNEDGYSGAVMLAKKLSEDCPEIFVNAALCRLLLASILLSTNNLDPSQSAEVDASMAAFLVIGARVGGCISLYEQLRAKKYNQTFLATEELLRSDFAQHDMGPGTRGKKGGEVLRVGICNVAISLAEMSGKDPQFADKLKAFLAAHSLHATFLLATYYSTTNKRFKKEIAIVSEISGLLSGVCYFLQQEKNDLKLKPITIRSFPSNAKAFALANTVITRGDLEKRLLEYFDDGR